MTSWARASVALITFAFINLTLFLILSSPIATIFGLIDDQAEEFEVEGDVTPIINTFRTVFGLSFVLSFCGIIVWFVLGSHSEEYETTLDWEKKRGGFGGL